MKVTSVFAVVAVTVVAIMWPVLIPSAERADKGSDRVWTHPKLGDFEVERIAMIPAATFDADFEAEKLVERAIGRALSPTGYRWVSATSTRYLLRAVTGNDPLLDGVGRRVLRDGRVDSLDAPTMCARLRCDALLSVRVDQWERHEMEWNQSGKPSTTVQIKAALVDSAGNLLWKVDGTHTADGPYHNATAAPLGVSESGLGRKPITGQGGAPSFLEVLDTLADRLKLVFPAKTSGAMSESDSTGVAPSRR